MLYLVSGSGVSWWVNASSKRDAKRAVWAQTGDHLRLKAAAIGFNRFGCVFEIGGVA